MGGKDQVSLTELLRLPSPWRVVEARLDAAQGKLIVEVEYPAGLAVFCPMCQAACVVHDHRERRQYRHLDCLQYQTWLVCRLPRSRCETHGVRTVAVPWAEPMARMTTQFEAHCISVLLACQTVTAAQRLLGLSDDEVMGVRQRAVKRGLARRELSPLRRGGLDEKSFLGGQSFVTVLSDLDGGCVLEVTRDRTQAAAEEALSVIPKEARGGVEAMALDMHQPFVNAVQATLPTADIVHDRFHIKKHLNDAVNKVRRAEHKERLSTGDKRLSGTRYLFLRNPQDLSEAERLSFDELCQMQLRVTRAWGLKELFDDLYTYRSEAWARRFFQKWFFRATHSQLAPVAKVAWMLKDRLAHVVSYVKHRITNAVAEGLNSKIQALKSQARGFRNFENYRTAILFHCGALNLLPNT